MTLVDLAVVHHKLLPNKLRRSSFPVLLSILRIHPVHALDGEAYPQWVDSVEIVEAQKHRVQVVFIHLGLRSHVSAYGLVQQAHGRWQSHGTLPH